MKILIKVTKQILQESMMCGINENLPISTNCAFALAVREIFPAAIVSTQFIRPFGRDFKNRIKLPEQATHYILAFDGLLESPVKRLELPEISIEVDVPSSIIEQVGISEVYKILSESKTLQCVSI